MRNTPDIVLFRPTGLLPLLATLAMLAALAGYLLLTPPAFARPAASGEATAPDATPADVQSPDVQTPEGINTDGVETEGVNSAAEAAAPGRRTAVVITLSGMVDSYMADGLSKRLADAREMAPDVVILKVNTWGGRVDSAIDMAQAIKQYPIHTIAYVEDKAISAGAMIAVAANEIAMEPNTLIGDAAPIMAGPGGMQSVGDTERAKMESPVLAEFADSAETNGHSRLLLQAMVSVGRSVYYLENTDTGERRFVDEAEYEKLTSDGSFFGSETPAGPTWRPVAGLPNPVDGPDTLLTVDANMAYKLGLSKGTFLTVEELAAERDLTIIARLEPTAGENLVAFLGGALVRGVLVTVLLVSVYSAFSAPGYGLPEAVALATLGVLLGVPALTGFAQWYEIVAVVLGIALIAVEIFILPGFGFFGITGIMMVLGGLVMTFVGPIDVPNLPLGAAADTDQLFTGLASVVGGMLASLLLWVWLGRYLPRLPFARGLVLTGTVGGGNIDLDDSNNPSDGSTGRSPLLAWPPVGLTGRTVGPLRPGGQARFNKADGTSEIVDVVGDRGYVPAAAEVTVTQIDGRRIVVRPANPARQANQPQPPAPGELGSKYWTGQL
ncbi:MAG: nodulation protein NfeD [Phycisphaerae bacterium]